MSFSSVVQEKIRNAMQHSTTNEILVGTTDGLVVWRAVRPDNENLWETCNLQYYGGEFNENAIYIKIEARELNDGWRDTQEELDKIMEENQVKESEEKPKWDTSNPFADPIWQREPSYYEDDLPDYDNITPEHPYTQRTIEQATKHLQPELLDSFRNMAIATAFYLVQLRLAGLSEHMAEMAIKEWHRSEMKVGPGRSEYEGALDNE